jgi:caspase domain-containing protein
MKKIVLLCFLVCISFQGQSQKIISGKSNKTTIKINPKFERGLPPNLYLNLYYSDDNNNGILEASERSTLKVTLLNKGAGKAQGLKVKVQTDIYDKELKVKDGQQIPFLMPGESVSIDIPIVASSRISSNEHKLEITISEHFGYDTDPAILHLSTYAYQKPALIFCGFEIVDSGQGSIDQNGQLQAGELAKVKISVQNIGNNISENTGYKVFSTDNNIYIDEGSGKLGNIKIGEVKDFWVSISPNKRVDKRDKLPIFLTLKNKYKIGGLEVFQLPIRLDEEAPKTNIVQIEAITSHSNEKAAHFETYSDKITAKSGYLSDVKQVPLSKTKRPDAVGVVIGVENYANLAPVPYATNDANIMCEYFKNVLGIKKVFTYTNEDVSGFFFDNTFDPDFGEMKKWINKGQTELFVYYSGNGMPAKNGSKLFLLPADVKIEALERQAYDLQKLFDNLDKLDAKKTIVFMDVGFNGAPRTSETYGDKKSMAGQSQTPSSEVLQPWLSKPTFAVFTSTGYNENTLGHDPSETGLFTYFLCMGLKGKADIDQDKKTSCAELGSFIRAKVIETSSQLGTVQSPQLYGGMGWILVE